MPVAAKVLFDKNVQIIRLPRQFRIDSEEVYIMQEKDYLVIFPKQKKFKSKKEIKEFLNLIHCPDFDISRRTMPTKPKDIF